MNNISVPDKSRRVALLAFHRDAIVRTMMEDETQDPVAFIIDATDRLGGELARVLIADVENLSLEQAEAKLARLRDEGRAREELLHLLFNADWQYTEELMSQLSPTASETLKRVRAKRELGMELVVVVADGGITYDMIGVNRPVDDGQHRTSSVPWKAGASRS